MTAENGMVYKNSKSPNPSIYLEFEAQNYNYMKTQIRKHTVKKQQKLTDLFEELLGNPIVVHAILLAGSHFHIWLLSLLSAKGGEKVMSGHQEEDGEGQQEYIQEEGLAIHAFIHFHNTHGLIKHSLQERVALLMRERK